jgi:hypothetical protein
MTRPSLLKSLLFFLAVVWRPCGLGRVSARNAWRAARAGDSQ